MVLSKVFLRTLETFGFRVNKIYLIKAVFGVSPEGGTVCVTSNKSSDGRSSITIYTVEEVYSIVYMYVCECD